MKFEAYLMAQAACATTDDNYVQFNIMTFVTVNSVKSWRKIFKITYYFTLTTTKQTVCTYYYKS